MAKYKTYLECRWCKGTGTVSRPDFPDAQCASCLGNGNYENLFIDLTELDTKIAVIEENVLKMTMGFPTYKILEVTDSDEYMALDANKKHWYDLFISAGTLDMNDGSKARDLFLAWIFPPGTATYTALLAILT
jgi:hypothetical protein